MCRLPYMPRPLPSENCMRHPVLLRCSGAEGEGIAKRVITIRLETSALHDHGGSGTPTAALDTATCATARRSLVRRQAIPRPSTSPSSPIHLLWILNIRILGNIVSCSCTRAHLCQGKFEGKGLVKSLSHANVRSLLHGLALSLSPESLRFACASVYILTLLLFTPSVFIGLVMCHSRGVNARVCTNVKPTTYSLALALIFED